MTPRKRGNRAPPGEPQPSLFEGRTRWIALGMVAFALVLLLWARHRDAPPARAASAGEEEATTGGPGSPAPPTLGFEVTPASAAAPAAPPPAEPAPVIDEILLEKPEVCAGEENLVTVRAHTINGTDPDLHYVIDGHMGQAFPVTLWKGDDGAVLGQHTITVFGRNNVATTVPLPSFEVKDCRPTFVAAINQHVKPNTWSDFVFLARVVGIPRAPTDADRKRNAAPPPVPKPFKAVSYSWDFGDGESAVTLGPDVEHSFEGRSQDKLYSYFVVSVTIRGEKGESVTGRTTLPLINPGYESLSQKGIVQLFIALDPQFPQLGPDGRVTQHVRIWHTRPDPVTIERAVLIKYFKQAAGQTDPEEVPVASVLGTTIIPPGKEGITTTVVLDPGIEEEVFSKTWNLAGKSADGRPALGSFSVMIPPPKPGPDSGAPVFDPLLKQKIILARQLLGKDVVDDDDLFRLEREGKFAGLKVTDQQAAAAASAAIADAIKRGPPSQGPPLTARGAPVPTSTAAQAAQPGQGSGPAPTGSK